jgi:hypothetical protein
MHTKLRMFCTDVLLKSKDCGGVRLIFGFVNKFNTNLAHMKKMLL